MKNDCVSGAAVLRIIERDFGRYRAENPGKKKYRYPRSLKALVSSKEARALSVREISHAARITPKSVCDWRASCPSTSPLVLAKELTVVAETDVFEESIVQSHEHPSSTRITLTNGVVIELPVAKLSTDLLVALCGLAVSR